VVLAYDGLMFYAAAAEQAGRLKGDALMKAVGEIKYDGLRGAGMSVRASDGQMEADVYTGQVAFKGSSALSCFRMDSVSALAI